jgi:hypothetical protein
LNWTVAIPRLVKMSGGRLPALVKPTPITAGKGPSPSGMVMAAVNVSEFPPSSKVTVSRPSEKLASKLLGGSGLVPNS